MPNFNDEYRALLGTLSGIRSALYLLVKSKRDDKNPVIKHKQDQLIDQLIDVSVEHIADVRNPKIVEQLKQEWEELSIKQSTAGVEDQESIRLQQEQLIVAYKALQSVAQQTEALEPGAKEDQIKTGIDDLNKSIRQFYALKNIGENEANIRYGRDLSDYTAYVGSAAKFVAMVWWAYTVSLPYALTAVGLIFPPVIWTVNAVRELFNVVAGAFKLRQMNVAAATVSDDDKRREYEDAQFILSRSVFARLCVFALNAVTALAFAGVMALPLAWVAVAVSSAIKWYDDQIVPARKAEEEYTKCLAMNKPELERVDNRINELRAQKDQQWDEKSKPLNKNERKELADLKEQKKEIEVKIESARLNAVSKRTEANWGAGNVVAMVLIACGPIPFIGPFLGMAGLGIFGLIALRNVAKAANDYFYPPKQTSVVEPTKLSVRSLDDVIDEHTHEHEKKHERKLTSTSVAQVSRLLGKDDEVELVKKKPVIAAAISEKSTYTPAVPVNAPVFWGNAAAVANDSKVSEKTSTATPKKTK